MKEERNREQQQQQGAKTRFEEGWLKKNTETRLSQDKCLLSGLCSLEPTRTGGTGGKEPACQCRRHEMLVRSLGWEDPLTDRRAWQPTPELLPGESQGQRSLVGYSPWGCKESDTTKAT